jgi:hypothetical protein
MEMSMSFHNRRGGMWQLTQPLRALTGQTVLWAG